MSGEGEVIEQLMERYQVGRRWEFVALADLGRKALRDLYADSPEAYLADPEPEVAIQGWLRERHFPQWLPLDVVVGAIPFYLGLGVPSRLAGDAPLMTVVVALAATALPPWDPGVSRALVRHLYHHLVPEAYSLGVACPRINLSRDPARKVWRTFVNVAGIDPLDEGRFKERMRRECDAVVGELRLGHALAAGSPRSVLERLGAVKLSGAKRAKLFEQVSRLARERPELLSSARIKELEKKLDDEA